MKNNDTAFEFQKFWVSPELLDLMRRKKISRTEFILLIVIKSLSNSEQDYCSASNQYLSEIAKITPNRTSIALQKLKALKLIEIIHHENHRTIRFL